MNSSPDDPSVKSEWPGNYVEPEDQDCCETPLAYIEEFLKNERSQ